MIKFINYKEHVDKVNKLKETITDLRKELTGFEEVDKYLNMGFKVKLEPSSDKLVIITLEKDNIEGVAYMRDRMPTSLFDSPYSSPQHCLSHAHYCWKLKYNNTLKEIIKDHMSKKEENKNV